VTSRHQPHACGPDEWRPMSCRSVVVDGAGVGDVTSARQSVPRRALFRESRYLLI